MSTITREQALAARKLLGWSRVKLSIESGVGNGVIVAFENGMHIPPTSVLAALKRTFVHAGVGFVEGEPGVRMKTPSRGGSNGRDS